MTIALMNSKIETPLFTRKQYMNKEINHHDYYAQFVTDQMVNYVVSVIGSEKILNSTDEHMNDIPLNRWDLLNVMSYLKDRQEWKTASLSTYSKEYQAENKFVYSQSDCTCLAKTAARIHQANKGA